MNGKMVLQQPDRKKKSAKRLPRGPAPYGMRSRINPHGEPTGPRYAIRRTNGTSICDTENQRDLQTPYGAGIGDDNDPEADVVMDEKGRFLNRIDRAPTAEQMDEETERTETQTGGESVETETDSAEDTEAKNEEEGSRINTHRELSSFVNNSVPRDILISPLTSKIALILWWIMCPLLTIGVIGSIIWEEISIRIEGELRVEVMNQSNVRYYWYPLVCWQIIHYSGALWEFNANRHRPMPWRQREREAIGAGPSPFARYLRDKMARFNERRMSSAIANLKKKTKFEMKRQHDANHQALLNQPGAGLYDDVVSRDVLN